MLLKAGDCCDLISTLPDNSVQLTVFSPPYDAIRDYEDNPAFDMLDLGRELYRVTEDGGIVAMVMNDGTVSGAKTLTTFKTAVQWCHGRGPGWRLFETVIYARDGKPGAWWNKRFRVDHEYVLIFMKGKRPRAFDKEHLKVPAKHAGKTWSGTQRTTEGTLIQIPPKIQSPLKCRGTIWHYKTSNTEGDKAKLEHPATMPALLAEDLIRTFSLPGDTVLDPMCGSGTALIAALKHGRIPIGFDVSQTYIDLTQRRIDAMKGKN